MSALGNMSGFIGMEELEARECFSASHKVAAPPPKKKAPAKAVTAAPAAPVSPRSVIPATTFQAPPGGPHALLDYTTTYVLPPRLVVVPGTPSSIIPQTTVRMTMLLGHDAKQGGLTGEILIYINNKLENTGNVHFSGTDGSMNYQAIFSGQSINIQAFASPDWSGMSGGFSDVFSTASVPPIEIPFGIPRVLLVG